MRSLACAVGCLLTGLLSADALAQGAGTTYTVPPDNPFVSTPGAAPEVWAYGLRNPFRWSFDRATGDFTAGDVGGATKEEIDFRLRSQTPGTNFGWPCREGSVPGPVACDPPDDVGPVLDYDNPDPGQAAVTGGYVVRDPNLPGFAGRYLYADFFAGDVRSAQLSAGGASGDASTGLNVPQLVSFGEDGAGGLLVVSLGGAVSRLVPGGAPGTLATSLVDNFASPMYATAPPGETARLFVLERAGRIMLKNPGAAPTTFLDISADVRADGERGFLSTAFAPDYASSGRFWVYYTDNDGDNRVDEFKRSAGDPDTADPATRRNLLILEHSSATNHNGGQLKFGPDRKLYLSTGDAANSATAQNLGSLHGKVLRISPLPAIAGASTSGTGGATTGAGSTLGEVRLDAAPPRVRTRFPSLQRVVRQGAVIGYFRSSEAGSLRATAVLDVPGASRILRARSVRRNVAAGRRYRLRMRLTRRQRRAVARALARRRRVRIRVTVRTRDLAGNLTRVSRRVRAAP